MSSAIARRAELVAALGTAGVLLSEAPGRHPPPTALIFGAGIELVPIHGQALASFRVTAIGGGFDAGASADALAALVATIVGTLRALAGWRFDGVGPDLVRVIAGAEYLSADVTASVHITL